MDPVIIVAIILANLNSFIPMILSSVKNTKSKTNLKKYSPQLRQAAQELVVIADAIDAL